jgi:PKD domain-containing protein
MLWRLLERSYGERLRLCPWSDPDGDPVTFTWTGPFGRMSGPTGSVSLSAGTYVITLIVRDGRGGSSSDTLVVNVVDATPRVILSATATRPNRLKSCGG